MIQFEYVYADELVLKSVSDIVRVFVLSDFVE